MLTYRELARCEQAVAAYRARTGHLPITLLELVVTGMLPAFPADPSGGEIVYNPTTGEVRSTALGLRQPLRISK